MKVNLTQEQIDFIYSLCNTVYDDYGHYSVEKQRDREEMAENIKAILLNADSGEIDEKELYHMASEYEIKRREIMFGFGDGHYRGSDIEQAYMAGYRKA